jgi:hypothetical protein
MRATRSVLQEDEFIAFGGKGRSKAARRAASKRVLPSEYKSYAGDAVFTVSGFEDEVDATIDDVQRYVYRHLPKYRVECRFTYLAEYDPEDGGEIPTDDYTQVKSDELTLIPDKRRWQIYRQRLEDFEEEGFQLVQIVVRTRRK